MTIIPIPSGTRDVLPDEMRELRAISDTLRGVFAEHGYGEVATPALEDAGVRVLVPQLLPANDGGIAYGQAAVAAARTAG